jgi:hypothetical protein
MESNDYLRLIEKLKRIENLFADRAATVGEPPDTAREPRAVPELEIIHSRSVQMGSDRLRVVATMDLVEVRALFARSGLPPGRNPDAGADRKRGSRGNEAPSLPDGHFGGKSLCFLSFLP